MSLSWQIVLIAVLLLLSGFFSSAEISLLSMSRWRVERLRSRPETRKRSELLARLLERPSRLLITILLGNNLVNVASTALTETLVDRHLGQWLSGASTAVAIVLMTVLLLIMGEVTPKTLALSRPVEMAQLQARPVRWLIWLTRPLGVVIEAFLHLVERALAIEGSGRGRLVSEAEFKTLVRQCEREGVLAEREGRFIRKVLSLKTTPVRNVMLPRTQIVALPEDASIAEALRLVRETGLLRIPVIRETVDLITGILYAKDLVPARLGLDHPRSIREVMRTPMFVPETKSVKSLLREMLQSRVHIAVVLDEQGGTAGLITLERILAEMIGDVTEEIGPTGKLLRPLSPEAAIVSGLLSLERFNAYFGTEFTHEHYHTVGGLVMSAFGRLPRVGDSIVIDGVRFEVQKIEGARIFELLVTLPREDAEDAAPGEPA
jgi:CBS domain containing-hemolysin-like protein